MERLYLGHKDSLLWFFCLFTLDVHKANEKEFHIASQYAMIYDLVSDALQAFFTTVLYKLTVKYFVTK